MTPTAISWTSTKRRDKQNARSLTGSIPDEQLDELGSWHWGEQAFLYDRLVMVASPPLDQAGALN
jgi:hypothetical protein